MMFNKEVLFAHTRVLLATGAGIAGMGITFNGAMQGNLIEMSRGVPLLLLGVWWAGRVLGQSMIASRRRRLEAGIIFRQGPAGRRAGLAGHGLDVWDVVETVQNEGGNSPAAAD